MSVAVFKGKLVKFLAKAGLLVPTRTTLDRSASPTTGETAFNTTDSKLEVYDGTEWVQLGAAVSSTETTTSGGYAISSSALNTQTTSYLLQSSDNGRIVLINSATAVNVTVPAGLPVGFNCSVIQIGAGQVTLVASGTTLNSANGLKISAQHGAASIISYSTDVYNVSGNTEV